jgi:ATP-dependent exoDNAse (exonuclease V) alpha subunit
MHNLTEEEQQRAHDGVVQALKHGNALLQGGPGVGKTFTTREIVRTLQEQGYVVGCAASTNKAASVLTNALGIKGMAGTTIHKALGLRLEESMGRTRLVPGGEASLPSFDVMLIDEASMLDDEVVDHIEAQAGGGGSSELDDVFGASARKAGTRILYIGDVAQLPPVGQGIVARPFRDPAVKRFTLTQVMRQKAGSAILPLLAAIRNHIDDELPLGVGAFAETELPDLRIMTRDHMGRALDELATYTDGDSLVIAWTNAVVDAAGQEMRIRRYGEQALRADYLPGETVLMRKPVMAGMQTLASVGELFEIQSAALCDREFDTAGNSFETVRYWALNLVGLPGVAINVVDRGSLAGWKRVLDYRRVEALSAGTSGAWQHFYTTRDWACDLQTHHAITAHRSQGSTYTRVVVDAADILKNPDHVEAARCLYVACSRPSQHLTLVF